MVVGAEHVDEAVEEHLPHSVVEFELIHHLGVTFPSDPVHFLRVKHAWKRIGGVRGVNYPRTQTLGEFLPCGHRDTVNG